MKITTLERLAEVVASTRRSGKKVAMCHGVFDLLHVGHLRHFKQARGAADVLIVTVTPDRFVNKGPGRPVFNEALRLEALAALEVVDFVALNKWPTATETIRLVQPDLYCKGSEYRDARNDLTGKISEEEEAVAAVGGRLLFTDDIVFSSSSLLNTHFAPLPTEATQFLSEFRRKHTFEEIVRVFEELRRLRVLVLGETIIDEYQFCETLGKSGKEPILVARLVELEKHVGGVLAVANHLADLVGEVTVLTRLGEIDSHEQFIREHLSPRVIPIFLTQRGAATIVKRRFVETYPFQKLFEVYVIEEEQRPEDQHNTLAALETALREKDVVVVADYGHGLLEREVPDRLCDNKAFLAVNTQKNAGNHGFNTVSKYHRADFVSISQGELRLDARTKTAPLEPLIRAVAQRVGASRMVVTSGSLGCYAYSPEDGIVRVPALTTSFRDRIGAGDAVFAVTSLLARMGTRPSVLGLIGNAAGAQAVETIGNRSALDRTSLLKCLQHLMK